MEEASCVRGFPPLSKLAVQCGSTAPKAPEKLLGDITLKTAQ
jgi:hypothetical protein